MYLEFSLWKLFKQMCDESKKKKCYSKSLTYKHNRKSIQYFWMSIKTHKNGRLNSGKATQHNTHIAMISVLNPPTTQQCDDNSYMTVPLLLQDCLYHSTEVNLQVKCGRKSFVTLRCHFCGKKVGKQTTKVNVSLLIQKQLNRNTAILHNKKQHYIICLCCCPTRYLIRLSHSFVRKNTNSHKLIIQLKKCASQLNTHFLWLSSPLLSTEHTPMHKSHNFFPCLYIHTHTAPLPPTPLPHPTPQPRFKKRNKWEKKSALIVASSCTSGNLPQK